MGAPRQHVRREVSIGVRLPANHDEIAGWVRSSFDGGDTLFIPIVLTSCGGFGPSAQKYLRHIYGRARENSCSDMGVGQLTIQTTWSTLHAATYWNMRLSVAGAAKDAQVQNDIILSDFTRNLVVVGRQPHPILTSRCMCCPGDPIALLWRFRELPDDLASYGPLPGLLSAAASLLFSCSVVAFSVLFTAAFLLLQSFCPLPFLVVLAPFILSIVRFAKFPTQTAPMRQNLRFC